jgi:putative ABC transport system ATP-binding protein
MTVLLELNHVSRVYHMGSVEVTALKDMNLSVNKGEFIVVLGPSGSGKTTLLNLIGGIDTPTEGAILFEGKPISDFNEKELTLYRREHIGFVFQFFNLIPTLTVEENVLLAAELVGTPKANSVDNLLDLVGLSERSNHFPSELSGGEQQRVAIARALAKDPPIILCDEATGELDSKTGVKILSLLRTLNTQQEKTIVFVTHNSVISKIATRVVILKDGEISDIAYQENPMRPEEIRW